MAKAPTSRVETGLQTTDGKPVVAVNDDAERKAQPEPKPSAPKVEKDVEITTDIGQRRALTTAELSILDASKDEQVNLLREAKEAHKDAAKRGMLGADTTATYTGDLELPRLGEEKAADLVSTRLLFDWRDGQGVLHQVGKILDLPANEAMKLIADGFAERANPPKVETAEDWLNEARAERDAARK